MAIDMWQLSSPITTPQPSHGASAHVCQYPQSVDMHVHCIYVRMYELHITLHKFEVVNY